MVTCNTPLTPEEIADRLIPKDAWISPDGKMVASVVAPAGKRGEHTESAIWVSRNGKPAVQFTGGMWADHSPRWSPDGRHLLFLSDRRKRGTFRLYLLPVDGGEAREVGTFEGALEGPAWSPDGRSIAVMRVDPETDAEKKKVEERDDAIWVDHDPKLNRLWVIDAEGGAARQVTFGPRQLWSFGWSRDGQQLAIVTSEDHTFDAFSLPAEVGVVGAGGGLVRKVAEFPVQPGPPAWVELPGGPGIAVATNNHRDDHADAVWVVPASGGTPKNVMKGYAGNVETLSAIADDPTGVMVRITEGLHQAIRRVDVGTGKMTNLTPKPFREEGAINVGPSISADGKTVAIVWSEGSIPEETYRAEVGGKPVRLTEFGKPFEGRLSEVREVRWQSDDLEIEGLLTLPAGYEAGKRYPLVVEIHGGPTWAWPDMCFLGWHDWAQMLASRGIMVLQPNPRGSTGRGSDFQARLQDDVGGGESRDLVNGALAMVEQGYADRDRLGIGGWSWGGYLTAFTITQTDIFKAAVMGAGLSNMVSDHGTGDIPHANILYYPGHPYEHMEHYLQSSALSHITKVVTPTLIVHGDNDDRVHPAQGMEMYRALRVLKVPVEFVRYPREPHGFRERNHQVDLMHRISDWFVGYLKP